jgi:hypothetical protein
MADEQEFAGIQNMSSQKLLQVFFAQKVITDQHN